MSKEDWISLLPTYTIYPSWLVGNPLWKTKMAVSAVTNSTGLKQLLDNLPPTNEKVLNCKTPHLSPDIIHAPALCTKCDEFPEQQKARHESKYNFTGMYVEGKKKCPAETYTPLDVLEKNPLNRIV